MATCPRRLHAVVQHLGHLERVWRFPDILRIRGTIHQVVFRYILDRLHPILYAVGRGDLRGTNLRSGLSPLLASRRQLWRRVRTHDAESLHGVLAGVARARVLRGHRRGLSFRTVRVRPSDVL